MQCKSPVTISKTRAKKGNNPPVPQPFKKTGFFDTDKFWCQNLDSLLTDHSLQSKSARM